MEREKREKRGLQWAGLGLRDIKQTYQNKQKGGRKIQKKNNTSSQACIKNTNKAASSFKPVSKAKPVSNTEP